MTAIPDPAGDPELMTPGEVAALFRVDAKTISRWDRAGRFPEGTVFRTLGGHRRYRTGKIRSMLAGAR